MTATERLRALLDGRGVEWMPYSAFSTLYTTPDGKPVRADGDFMEGRVELYVRNLTPEQAVEATLGSGTCRECAGMEDVFECSECGMRYEGWALKRWARYCPNCGRRVAGA